MQIKNWSECDPAIEEFFMDLTGAARMSSASGKGIVEDEDD